jgi:hypothetical protein
MSMESAWAMTKITGLSLIAVAGLISGIRIYQGMQRGDDFEGPALRWLGGLVGASALVYAVEAFLYTDGAGWASAGTSPHFVAVAYASEAHQAVLYIGLMLGILGLIRVYRKFRDGDEDIYEFMLKWFGSIMFLFMMGWIIDTLLN